MENDIVVEFALGQLLDPRHMFGGEIGAQQNGNTAVFGLQINQIGLVRFCSRLCLHFICRPESQEGQKR